MTVKVGGDLSTEEEEGGRSPAPLASPLRAGGGLTLPGSSLAAAAKSPGHCGALPGMSTVRLPQREAQGLQGRRAVRSGWPRQVRAQGESWAFRGWEKQEDAKSSQIAVQRQAGPCEAGLSALTAPARILGRKQPFPVPKWGPCPQTPSSTRAVTMRCATLCQTYDSRHPFSNTTFQVRTLSSKNVTCLKWQAFKRGAKFLMSVCLIWKLPKSRCQSVVSECWTLSLSGRAGKGSSPHTGNQDPPPQPLGKTHPEGPSSRSPSGGGAAR